MKMRSVVSTWSC